MSNVTGRKWLTPEEDKAIAAFVRNGNSYTQAANEFGVSWPTVQQVMLRTPDMDDLPHDITQVYRVVIDVYADSIRDLVSGLSGEGDLISIERMEFRELDSPV